jgi:hypothetical protein
MFSASINFYYDARRTTLCEPKYNIVDPESSVVSGAIDPLLTAVRAQFLLFATFCTLLVLADELMFPRCEGGGRMLEGGGGGRGGGAVLVLADELMFPRCKGGMRMLEEGGGGRGGGGGGGRGDGGKVDAGTETRWLTGNISSDIRSAAVGRAGSGIAVKGASVVLQSHCGASWQQLSSSMSQNGSLFENTSGATIIGDSKSIRSFSIISVAVFEKVCLLSLLATGSKLG